jgi:hypothetical protein
MDAHGELPVNWLIAFQLRIEGPFIQRGHAGDGEFTMLARLQNDDRHFGIFRNHHAGFHPVVEFLAVQRGGDARPRSRFGDRPELLVLVQWQPVNMDFRKLQHIFLVVCLMRGLIAGHGMSRSWPSQNYYKRYREYWPHHMSILPY